MGLVGGILGPAWGRFEATWRWLGPNLREVLHLGACMSQDAEADTDFIVFGSRNRSKCDVFGGAGKPKYVTIVGPNAFLSLWT